MDGKIKQQYRATLSILLNFSTMYHLDFNTVLTLLLTFYPSVVDVMFMFTFTTK